MTPISQWLPVACDNIDVTFLYQIIRFLYPASPLSLLSFSIAFFHLFRSTYIYFFLTPYLLLFLVSFSFTSWPPLILYPSLPHSLLVPVSSLPLLPLPRCWKASQSVSRRISVSIWTGRCCRTVRLLKAPPRAASGRWPWSSRPPTHPLVTRWSTLEMSLPPSISYPGDP